MVLHRWVLEDLGLLFAHLSELGVDLICVRVLGLEDVELLGVSTLGSVIRLSWVNTSVPHLKGVRVVGLLLGSEDWKQSAVFDRLEELL